MATAKKTIAHNVELITPILSYTDGAFKQATASDTVTDFAKFVMEKNSGFGTADFKLSDKVKEEIIQGYRMRFSARNPAKAYAVIGNEYFDMEKIEPSQKDKVKEKIEVGVEVALNFTSNEFGKLANDRPQYHKLIGNGAPILALTAQTDSRIWKEKQSAWYQVALKCAQQTLALPKRSTKQSRI